ncbi:MAG: DUF4252 domain-containing protein, partial [Muribaculaceae bacterium]|nr:DUF4252 domain-containing protein [Muribaculaceae bacterium]
MKRLYILSILFILAVVSVNAQVSKVFEQYSDTKGVTLVYISSTMLKMIPDVKTGDVEFKGMTDKLNFIRVLSTGKADLATKISSELNDQIKKDSYEILISANDGGERANIYMKTDSKGVNEYLIVARESNQLSLVLINGTITPA